MKEHLAEIELNSLRPLRFFEFSASDAFGRKAQRSREVRKILTMAGCVQHIAIAKRRNKSDEASWRMANKVYKSATQGTINRSYHSWYQTN
jgi:hypothetical protein